MNKSYHDLIKFRDYGDRLAYLQLRGKPYRSPRDISNPFYKTSYWRELRQEIIRRDLGCDLGVFGEDIKGEIIIHHINPLKEEDIINLSDKCLDPDNLICVSVTTHNLIHYGSKSEIDERTPGDTKLW